MYDILYTIFIGEEEYVFEWDIEKEKTNITKHGINFSTAALCYLDKDAIEYLDRYHSDYEERWVCIGKTRNIICSLVYTKRNNIIRIITARKASKFEEKTYYGENS